MEAIVLALRKVLQTGLLVHLDVRQEEARLEPLVVVVGRKRAITESQLTITTGTPLADG